MDECWDLNDTPVQAISQNYSQNTYESPYTANTSSAWTEEDEREFQRINYGATTNDKTTRSCEEDRNGSSWRNDRHESSWRNDRPESSWRDDRPESSWRDDRPESSWRGSTNEQPIRGDARNSYSFNNNKKYGFSKSPRDSSEIEIDSNLVGKVIGRGGSKIQELQQASGAYIKIMKEGNSYGKASIRLSGSPEACEKAKSLIDELTADFGRLSTSKNYTSYNSSNNSSSYSSNNTSEYTTGKAFYGYVENDEPLIDWEGLRERGEIERKKKLASLPPLKKNFYIEDPIVASMSAKQVSNFRAKNNSITVARVDTDDDKPIANPITTFQQAFAHYPELLQELQKQGFTTPSPIQCQAWPIILSGHDLIGIAQTGTGKTIAFLFPALIHIVGQTTPRNKRVGPSCVVMAPTRELAQQIEMEAKKYSYHNISCVCIYGGGNRRSQINVCTKGVDIVIATPGRLNDLVMNKVIDVTGVTYLVLDEADRMLDLGFEPQIRKIVLDIRPDRQTIMTSATWTNEIQELASRYMIKPIKVNVGALDLAAVHTVTQEIIFAADEERRDLLMDFLESMAPDDKVIVFVERKSIADDISSDLLLQGVECQSIHGDREQCDREQALNDLKTGIVRILIATDVASRGLDIKDITHIFNMYFPHNIEEYVHRVGRTGRAGRTGTAISIFTRQDWMHAESFIKILEEASQFVPDELYEMADRYRAWKRKKDAEDAAAGGNRRFRGGRSRRY